MQYKPRVLNAVSKAYGIAIPKDIAIFVKNTYFYVEKSGGDVWLRSGTFIKVDDKTVESYEFKDCRIKIGEDSNTK